MATQSSARSRSSAAWRAATPTWRPAGGSQFRIGINLGDVIVERDDIFGDGVNVAARLQTLAEPGGICVSRAVRDQVQVGDRFDVEFEDLGEQSVKNIARPIRVFRVLLEEKAAAATQPAAADRDGCAPSRRSPYCRSPT